jgi:hypothetical protein
MKINVNGINRVGINVRNISAYPSPRGVTGGTTVIGAVSLALTNSPAVVNNGVSATSKINNVDSVVIINPIKQTSVINTATVGINQLWSLVDDFGSNTMGPWWQIMSSSVTQITTAQSGGYLVITPNITLASGENGYLTSYDGTLDYQGLDNNIIFHVSQAAPGAVETRVGFMETSDHTFIGFGITGSSLNTYGPAGALSTTTPLGGLWFRMYNEGDGVVIYDTSSDGMSWTTINNTSLAAGNKRLYISTKVNGIGTVARAAYIDSVGIIGSDNYISVNSIAPTSNIGTVTVTIGGGDATVNATSVSGTSIINAASSLTADSNTTITGVIGTSIINSVTITLNYNVTVIGIYGTSVINSSTAVTADANTTVAGVEGDSVIRSVTVDALTSPLVTGVYSLSVVNTGTENGNANTTITGVHDDSVVGTVIVDALTSPLVTGVYTLSVINNATTITANATAVPTTVYGTSGVGSTNPTADSNNVLIGVSGSSIVGAIVVEVDESDTVSGVSVTSGIGSVTVSAVQSPTVDVTGISTISIVNSVTNTADGSTSTIGVVGTSTTGIPSVTANATEDVTGVYALSIINSVTIDAAQSPTVDVIGVYGLSVVGIPTVQIQQDTIANAFGVVGVSVINFRVVQNDVNVGEAPPPPPPQIVYANTQPIYQYGGGGGGGIATSVKQYHEKEKRKKIKIHSIKIITEEGKKPRIRIIKS